MATKEQARDFLTELNQLITKTDMSIIRQAKANAMIRIRRAHERNEGTELWYRLADLVDACQKCKRVLQ